MCPKARPSFQVRAANSSQYSAEMQMYIPVIAR
jgi:hypothetical protein